MHGNVKKAYDNGKREMLEGGMKDAGRNVRGMEAAGVTNRPLYEGTQRRVLESANELRRMGVRRGTDQPRPKRPAGPAPAPRRFAQLSESYRRKAGG